MTDKELIDGYINGNENCIEILLERYLQGIFGVCYNMNLKKEDAEDVTQEVCYKIIKNIKNFRFQSELKTWIYKIAYNETLNYIKNNKLIYNFDEKLDSKHINENTTKDIDDIYKKEIVNHEIGLLNEIDKNIIILFYYESMRISDIAYITGMTESNIKVRLHRTKIILKNNFEKYGETFKNLL